MTKRDAKELAVELMRQHGLDGWRFRFDSARRRLGACWHQRREISLSGPLTVLNPEPIVRNTVLHEIAHALVGPKHKHNWVWREKARAIGCDGARLAGRETVLTQPTFRGTCPSCSRFYNRFRRLRGGLCRYCHPWRPALLVWTRVNE